MMFCLGEPSCTRPIPLPYTLSLEIAGTILHPAIVSTLSEDSVMMSVPGPSAVQEFLIIQSDESLNALLRLQVNQS